ncbi:MAG: DUF4199 domain-containing protein [Rikenellaceae bacterium]
MDNRSFWNEVAKQGVLLGIVMSASKIFEQSLVIYGGLEYSLWVMLEWLLATALFFVILFKATQKRAALVDSKMGFSFMQGVNYMMLISIFASVLVACVYYVYINSFIGYDNYMDAVIAVVVNAAESQPIDASTADMIELLVDQMREQPQPSIFSVLFSTIFQYAFAALIVGLILAGFISRKPEVFKNENE